MAKLLKLDPALMAGPLITTLVDTISLIIYFALAKAFFEYFEIENKDIERSAGLTSDTHFWNMVNIGTSAKPRWYFFDATRYAGKFTVGGDNGCLLTEAQLEGYKASNSKYDGVYYAFDSAAYPKAETEIINDKYSFK